MTRQELHKTRLASDYRDMCSIKSPVFSWEAVRGEPPYVEEYRWHIRVHTYADRDKPIDSCTGRTILPPEYPTLAPETRMEGTLVYHPNWFSNGRYCCGIYQSTESLVNYLSRMINSLQFDPYVTNPKSPANPEAKDWYLRHKNDKSMFPSDHLPPLVANCVQGFRPIRKR